MRVLVAALLAVTASFAEEPREAKLPITVVFSDNAVLKDAVGFDLSPRGNLVIYTRDNLFDVGANRYLLARPRRIDHAAFMRDATLLAVSDEVLCVYQSSNRSLREAVKLPLPGMKLAAGLLDTGFLYGGVGKGYGLYRFTRASGFQPLIVGQVFVSIVSVGDRLYAATRDAIYTFKNEEPLALVHRHAGDPIVSLTYHPLGAVIFSTKSAIFVAAHGKAAKIIDGFGGFLKTQENQLHVLTDQALLRLDNIWEVLAWDMGPVNVNLVPASRNK